MWHIHCRASFEQCLYLASKLPYLYGKRRTGWINPTIRRQFVTFSLSWRQANSGTSQQASGRMVKPHRFLTSKLYSAGKGTVALVSAGE